MDWIRAIAIIFVLIIHSAHECVYTDQQELIAGWFSTVTRPAIAMFLFISGYFFKEYPSFSYLLTRYKRVLIPYLFFSFLAILYQQRIIYVFNYVVSDWDTLFINLLIGYTWGVYWFIPLIIFVYSMAFLVLHFRFGQNLLLLTLVLFVINLLHSAYYVPLIQSCGIEDNKLIWYYSYRFFISWPFFFFLGLLFRKYNIEKAITDYSGVIIFLWIATFLVVNALYFTGVGLDMYNSVIGTIYSLATICLILLINLENRVITFISKISYLIYLAHYFFVTGFKAAEGILGIQWPFWFWLISFFVSLIGPMILYFLAKKILREKSSLVVGA
jgi:peptidoglycan/LPS O-acetylase OafA/YrhL